MAKKRSHSIVEISGNRNSLEKGYFNKNIATVYIRGTLSSFERKLWNLLTRNAHPNLEKTNQHILPISVLKESGGFVSNDVKIIKDALKKLQSTPIEWIREEGGEGVERDDSWLRFSFLATVGMVDGNIYYEYSTPLRSQLKDPEVYARINLEAQQNLPKGRALTLYEITSRYRPNKKKGFLGGTPKWSIEYFRELMGATAKSFNDFKYLNRNIISPNVKKVNEYTDIVVECTTFKAGGGKKNTHIQFSVRDNPQLPLFTEEDVSQKPLYDVLIQYGVAPLQAEGFLKDFEEDYLQRKVDLLKRQIAENKIKSSPSGYLVRAIKEDYSDEDPKSLLKKAEEEKRTAKKAKEAEKLRKEEEQKAEERKAKESFEKGVTDYLDSLREDEIETLKEIFYDDFISDSFEFIKKGWEEEGIQSKWVSSYWIEFVGKRIGLTLSK